MTIRCPPKIMVLLVLTYPAASSFSRWLLRLPLPIPVRLRRSVKPSFLLRASEISINILVEDLRHGSLSRSPSVFRSPAESVSEGDELSRLNGSMPPVLPVHVSGHTAKRRARQPPSLSRTDL